MAGESTLLLRNRSRAAGVCVAWALAGAVTFLIGARPASAAAATPPAEQKVEVISAAEIPSRADAEEQFIQAALRRSETTGRDDRFEQTLLSLSSGVQQLAAQSSATAVPTVSRRTLASLLRHWQFYERAILRWRVDLHRATKASLEDSASLASRRAVWQATRLAIAVAVAAPGLLQRVDETVDDIDRAAAAVSATVSKSLDLERRGNALLAQVDSEKADVLTSIADQDRRLLTMDSPPLWQAAGSAESRIPGGIRETLEIDAAFGRDYDAAHINAMRVSIVGGVLLLPLMLWLRSRARRAIEARRATEVSMHALLRPWAAWLVLVALDEVLFGSRGPIIRQELVLALAWIPVLRLLPPRILETSGRGRMCAPRVIC